MSQIVSGLLYLHSHGIVHRDLSPTNILLKNNMDVKIADFGLAMKISTPADKHYTMCGTPNYISPEIANQGINYFPLWCVQGSKCFLVIKFHRL